MAAAPNRVSAPCLDSRNAGRSAGLSGQSVPATVSLSLFLTLLETTKKDGPAVTADRAVFYTIGAASFAVEPKARP